MRSLELRVQRADLHPRYQCLALGGRLVHGARKQSKWMFRHVLPGVNVRPVYVVLLLEVEDEVVEDYTSLDDHRHGPAVPKAASASKNMEPSLQDPERSLYVLAFRLLAGSKVLFHSRARSRDRLDQAVVARVDPVGEPVRVCVARAVHRVRDLRRGPADGVVEERGTVKNVCVVERARGAEVEVPEAPAVVRDSLQDDCGDALLALEEALPTARAVF